MLADTLKRMLNGLLTFGEATGVSIVSMLLDGSGSIETIGGLYRNLCEERQISWWIGIIALVRICECLQIATFVIKEKLDFASRIRKR